MVIERKCRDVLCSLFFLCFWAGMFVILGLAVRDGECWFQVHKSIATVLWPGWLEYLSLVERDEACTGL
jgi:hypothetical protein